MTTPNGGGNLPAPMRQLTPQSNKWARAQARGWNDVRDGRGFRDDYDLWPVKYEKDGKKMQFAYERGRQRATIAKTRLLEGRKNIAVWKRDEIISEVLDRSCGIEVRNEIMDETSTVRKGTAS